MSQTTLLKDGCPCKHADCGNHGNCAECIRYHVEVSKELTTCMGNVMRAQQAETEEK